jgi:hypothetical protein
MSNHGKTEDVSKHEFLLTMYENLIKSGLIRNRSHGGSEKLSEVSKN